LGELFSIETPLPDDEGVTAGLGILGFASEFTHIPARCVGHDGSLNAYHSIALHCAEVGVTLAAISDAEPRGDELDERVILHAAAAVLFPKSSPPSSGAVAP
jgi:hypothetical protein